MEMMEKMEMLTDSLLFVLLPYRLILFLLDYHGQEQDLLFLQLAIQWE